MFVEVLKVGESEKMIRWALNKILMTWDYDLNVGKIILDHFLKGSFHFICQSVEMSFLVIFFAVIPYKLYMI
jgi:hypothetical protein